MVAGKGMFLCVFITIASSYSKTFCDSPGTTIKNSAFQKKYYSDNTGWRDQKKAFSYLQGEFDSIDAMLGAIRGGVAAAPVKSNAAHPKRGPQPPSTYTEFASHIYCHWKETVSTSYKHSQKVNLTTYNASKAKVIIKETFQVFNSIKFGVLEKGTPYLL